ncbi:MAG: hypothetical protein ABSD67_17385 [Terracidiphilus sp.]|jgi:hypothetical protein
MRRFFPVALMAFLLASPLSTQTTGAVQTADDSGEKNARQARTALDAMVKALGGDAWLNMKNQERDGQVAAFFHGKPDAGTTQYFEFHQWPDHDRIEYTKHRDVVQFYIGRLGQEVTYKGKAALPQEQVDDWLRRRDHSIETAVKVWLKDPRTILLYEGQRLAERHLADTVTLISPENEAITIQMDTQTHLPLRRTFEWRDPLYKDKNLDAEEYDDYHVMDGFPTPFTITRFKNDDQIRQYFLVHVKYNQNLPADFWDVEATTRRIKK